MGEWISINERLPSDYGKYLVVYFYYRPRVTIAWFEKVRKSKKYYWFKFETDFYTTELKRVTHWMSLPDPPKDK